MPFKYIGDIKRANKQAGQNFFEAGNMEFWGSSVVSGVLRGEYFITSEDNFDRTRKLFTVRKAHCTGQVTTVGEFQQHETVEDAKKWLKEHLKKPKFQKKATV